MTRTHDLLITNQLLYRLSYTSAPEKPYHSSIVNMESQHENFCGIVITNGNMKEKIAELFAYKVSVTDENSRMCFKDKRLSLEYGKNKGQNYGIRPKIYQ